MKKKTFTLYRSDFLVQLRLKISKDWIQLTESSKKHPENADTFTSVTLDLDMRPWPCDKVKNACVIKCRLLYCIWVPSITLVDVKVYETSPSFCDLWHSIVTFSDGHFHCKYEMSLVLSYICIKYEVYRLFVWNCSLADRQTDRQIDKLPWKYNTSVISWRGKYTFLILL